jgi:ABC-type glutathione transport system ATPase component
MPERQEQSMNPGPRSNGSQLEPLLRVSGLGKQYLQRRPFSHTKIAVDAFQDVSLTIFPGKTLAVVGESGAGKSSLARCIALLEPATNGTVELAGTNLAALSGKELFSMRREVQLIFQDPSSALNPRLTACEIIAEPLLIQGQGTKSQRRARALQLMEQVGLDPAWERKRPLEFSGGQRQRVAIARALALGPHLLILDEALANLDAANQTLILKLLAELQAAHSLSFLHISHDLRLVSEFADEVAVMRLGRIVEWKSTRNLFASPEHSYTRELLASVRSVQSILLERSA